MSKIKPNNNQKGKGGNQLRGTVLKFPLRKPDGDDKNVRIDMRFVASWEPHEEKQPQGGAERSTLVVMSNGKEYLLHCTAQTFDQVYFDMTNNPPMTWKPEPDLNAVK